MNEVKTKEDLILYLDRQLMLENNEAKVSIPNDIFIRLAKIENMKDSRQLSFCFSYLILNAFLSKYCLYWDYAGESFITKKDMKVILGYHRENKTINHLIKVGGELETKNLLTHDTDIPVFHDIKKTSETRDNKRVDVKEWELSFVSDMPQQIQDDYKLLKRTGNSSFSAPMPNFIFGIGDNQETLNDRTSTFTVTYKSFRKLMFEDADISLVDILVIYFMRHIGYSGKLVEISYEQILVTLKKMSRATLRKSLLKIKDKKMLEIIDTGFTYELVTDKHGIEKGVFKRNTRRYKVS